MESKVKKLFTCHRMYHLRADRVHFYVKKENGGSGLIEQKLTYKKPLQD